ncbi:hypothetical protein BKK79_13320 [Cupriavidus sp. USMAA2-4]|uniref:DUF3047 domain-containing protein n=1 Tax=Cupriavidus sp. USMAA2-4 TaxID=876364 RepID=UPI0008A70E6E|nr:hypothetical protein BKK79_13320 [Cupriavidus sp. USMAA2-4]
MESKWCLLALSGIVSAAGLTGCSSMAPMQPQDPDRMVSVAPMECSTFATRVATHAQHQQKVTASPQVAAAADEGAAGADADEESGEAEPAPRADLPLFSTAPVGQPYPSGWHPWRINRNKTPTRYGLVAQQDQVVMHAQADASASGLYVPLTARDAGMLRWAWRTRDVIRTADNTLGSREDAPLRVFVAFDGDKGNLSLKDQLMYEMARLTTGREMPYATLMYIWAGRRPAGSILPNPHTDRVRMIVADSGLAHTGEWRCHERDLRADYRKAFGQEPGRVIAVGIMTDTDNTRTRAESWYGDILLD